MRNQTGTLLVGGWALPFVNSGLAPGHALGDPLDRVTPVCASVHAPVSNLLVCLCRLECLHLHCGLAHNSCLGACRVPGGGGGRGDEDGTHLCMVAKVRHEDYRQGRRGGRDRTSARGCDLAGTNHL